MRAQKIFKAAPITVQGIGGVWNVKVWIFLICIQKWQILFETVVCRSHSAMRVPPVFGSNSVCPFVDEVSVFFEPNIEFLG